MTLNQEKQVTRTTDVRAKTLNYEGKVKRAKDVRNDDVKLLTTKQTKKDEIKEILKGEIKIKEEVTRSVFTSQTSLPKRHKRTKQLRLASTKAQRNYRDIQNIEIRCSIILSELKRELRHKFLINFT